LAEVVQVVSGSEAGRGNIDPGGATGGDFGDVEEAVREEEVAPAFAGGVIGRRGAFDTVVAILDGMGDGIFDRPGVAPESLEEEEFHGRGRRSGRWD
jgi:hypothetical protein